MPGYSGGMTAASAGRRARPWGTRTLPARAGLVALACWLGGCTVPPQAVPPASPPEPPPLAATEPLAGVPSLAREAALVPEQTQAEPALRIKPERAPGDSPGAPALRPPAPAPQPEPPVLLASGQASWYADSLHGRRTANGERYDRGEFTAAHRSLPFGARLCVRSPINGRTVIVRVNDRGPFTPGRIIDLSRAAADELGMLGLGIKSVELWRLGDEDDGCPERLEQAVEGGGLGLDAAAAAKVLQQRPAARPRGAGKPPPRRKRR